MAVFFFFFSVKDMIFNNRIASERALAKIPTATTRDILNQRGCENVRKAEATEIALLADINFLRNAFKWIHV